MVPKQQQRTMHARSRFRAVLFRMVPKLKELSSIEKLGFRAVLFRMVPKLVAETQ